MKKDNFRSECAPRIKEERVRLGLTQEQVASACEVSREMWGRYERGSDAMGGEYLFSFAALGADTNFVLTGVRRTEPVSIKAEEPYVSYSNNNLREHEQQLLDDYSACTDEGKAAILATAAALAQAAKKV